MKLQIILISSFILTNFLHTVSAFPTHNQSHTTPDSGEDDSDFDDFDKDFSGLQEVSASMGKQSETITDVEATHKGGNPEVDLVDGNDTQESSSFTRPIHPKSAKCGKFSSSEMEACMKHWKSEMEAYSEATEKYNQKLDKLTEGGNEIWTSNGYSIKGNGSKGLSVDYDGNSVFRLKVSIGQYDEFIEDRIGKKIIWQVSYPSKKIIWIALKVPENIDASTLQSEVTDDYIQVDAFNDPKRNHPVKTTDSSEQQPKANDGTITPDSNDKHHNSGALTSVPIMSFIVSFAVLIN